MWRRFTPDQARKVQATQVVKVEIPDKIYYSIREVSQYTDVPPHVLRYWETKFSRLAPERAGGNQRKYTKADLEIIFEIKELLHGQGYTLSGAEKHLRNTYRKKTGKAGKEEAAKPEAVQAKVASAENNAIAKGEGSVSVKVPRITNQISEIRRELNAILELVS